MLVIDGEPKTLEGPVITAEDAEQFLCVVADTRQRRHLREFGAVQFIYRFRERVSFVVQARIAGENVKIEIF